MTLSISKFVSKHYPGRHDQKTHGNRHTTSKPDAPLWKPTPSLPTAPTVRMFLTDRHPVVKHGTTYRAPVDSDANLAALKEQDLLPGKLKECFENAALAANERPHLTYVEGYATTPIGLPVHHAWLVDVDGNVIDPTWSGAWVEVNDLDYSAESSPGVEYHGIPIPTDILRRRLVDRGVWGFFVTHRDWTGFDPAEIAKHYPGRHDQTDHGNWARGFDAYQDNPPPAIRAALETDPVKLLETAVLDWKGMPSTRHVRDILDGSEPDPTFPKERWNIKVFEDRNQARVLLDALHWSPPTPVPLFRGANMRTARLPAVGDIIEMPWAPASPRRQIAREFINDDPGPNHTGVLFEFPPGTHALPINRLFTYPKSRGTHQDEDEHLISDTFEVAAIKPWGKVTRIVLKLTEEREIPPAPESKPPDLSAWIGKQIMYKHRPGGHDHDQSRHGDWSRVTESDWNQPSYPVASHLDWWQQSWVFTKDVRLAAHDITGTAPGIADPRLMSRMDPNYAWNVSHYGPPPIRYISEEEERRQRRDRVMEYHSARTLLDALHDSDPDDRWERGAPNVLYRGVAVSSRQTPLWREAIAPGKTLDLPLLSATEELHIAEGHAHNTNVRTWLGGDKPDYYYDYDETEPPKRPPPTHQGWVYEIASPTAIRSKRWVRRRQRRKDLWGELETWTEPDGEWVTGGRFKVLSVDPKTKRVQLQQIGVWDSDGNFHEKRVAVPIRKHPGSDGSDIHDTGTGQEIHAPRPKPSGGIPEAFDSWTPDEQDAFFSERRRERNEWEYNIRRALSLGELTVEQAQSEFGWYPSGDEANWEPLPAELYHVTTAADSILQTGHLKSRSELYAENPDKPTGLGGGSSDTISFTADPAIAEGIRQAMLEARLVARNEITIEDLIQGAKDGGFYDNMVRYWDHNRQPGDPEPKGLQLVRQGLKSAAYVGKEEGGAMKLEDFQRAHPDWQPAAITDSGYVTMAHRPNSPSEQTQARFDLYKTFLTHREQATGQLDPLFWGTDPESLAQIDPDQIQTLHFRPKPGAKGYRMGALGEWRTATGEAVELVQPKPLKRPGGLAIDPTLQSAEVEKKRRSLSIAKHYAGQHDQKNHGRRKGVPYQRKVWRGSTSNKPLSSWTPEGRGDSGKLLFGPFYYFTLEEDDAAHYGTVYEYTLPDNLNLFSSPLYSDYYMADVAVTAGVYERAIEMAKLGGAEWPDSFQIRDAFIEAGYDGLVLGANGTNMSGYPWDGALPSMIVLWEAKGVERYHSEERRAKERERAERRAAVAKHPGSDGGPIHDTGTGQDAHRPGFSGQVTTQGIPLLHVTRGEGVDVAFLTYPDGSEVPFGHESLRALDPEGWEVYNAQVMDLYARYGFDPDQVEGNVERILLSAHRRYEGMNADGKAGTRFEGDHPDWYRTLVDTADRLESRPWWGEEEGGRPKWVNEVVADIRALAVDNGDGTWSWVEGAGDRLAELDDFYGLWNSALLDISGKVTNVDFHRMVANSSVISPRLEAWANLELAVDMAYLSGANPKLLPLHLDVLRAKEAELLGKKEKWGPRPDDPEWVPNTGKWNKGHERRLAEVQSALALKNPHLNDLPDYATAIVGHQMRRAFVGTGFRAGAGYDNYGKGFAVLRGYTIGGDGKRVDISISDILDGVKTRSFANNIADPYDVAGRRDVTIDIWASDGGLMGRGFGDLTSIVSGASFRTVVSGVRGHMKDQYDKVAVKYDMIPLDVQQRTWAELKRALGSNTSNTVTFYGEEPFEVRRAPKEKK